MQLEGEYAFWPSLGIEVDVPYTFRDSSSESNENNLDNVEVALKYANFTFQDKGVLLGGGIELGQQIPSESGQNAYEYSDTNCLSSLGIRSPNLTRFRSAEFWHTTTHLGAVCSNHTGRTFFSSNREIGTTRGRRFVKLP